ncbi:hypothetical protein Tco_0001235 [Tanacetum coccineum]
MYSLESSGSRSESSIRDDKATKSRSTEKSDDHSDKSDEDIDVSLNRDGDVLFHFVAANGSSFDMTCTTVYSKYLLRQNMGKQDWRHLLQVNGSRNAKKLHKKAVNIV